jgi:hypothetical protein
MDFGQRPATLQAHLPQLAAALEWAAAFIEACAIAILILGFLRFFYHFARAELRRAPKVEGTSEVAASRIVLALHPLGARGLHRRRPDHAGAVAVDGEPVVPGGSGTRPHRHQLFPRARDPRPRGAQRDMSRRAAEEAGE